jgi:hypothetical protein
VAISFVVQYQDNYSSDLNSHFIHLQKSTNNHFMFWKRKSSAPRDFKPPTSFDKKMGFEKWLAKAYEVFK